MRNACNLALKGHDIPWATHYKSRLGPEDRSTKKLANVVEGSGIVAVVVVLKLKTPDELRELSALRAATPTVAHPDGQYRPGE
jgi:hypothetical protein